MPEHKHTRGPWKAINLGKHWNNKDIDNWIITFNDDGEQVVDHVYEEADALLIAAAPDLLQALEGLLRQVEAYDLPLSDPERIAARAAIAKALGQA